MNAHENKEYSTEERIRTLKQYLTESRYTKLLQVLQYRTKYITVLLENIRHNHNASAVLRSCEAYGIQDIHVVETNSTFMPNNSVSSGSAKWLSVHKYTDTTHTYNELREKGYKIYATSSSDNSNTLDTFDLSDPAVIAFGSEITGLTQQAIQLADSTLYIPMFGFVESFNISVSVAIILSKIITELHNSRVDWKLSKQEMESVLLQWLRTDIHKSSELEEKFF